jgi:hypothetical protein
MKVKLNKQLLAERGITLKWDRKAQRLDHDTIEFEVRLNTSESGVRLLETDCDGLASHFQLTPQEIEQAADKAWGVMEEQILQKIIFK